MDDEESHHFSGDGFWLLN